jgi:hypothetical protein
MRQRKSREETGLFVSFNFSASTAPAERSNGAGYARDAIRAAETAFHEK